MCYWTIDRSKNKSKGKILIYLEINESITHKKLVGHSQSISKMKVHGDKCPSQTKPVSDRQPNSPPPGTRKRRTKPTVRRREEITEMRAEINKRLKRPCKRSRNGRAGSLKR